MKTYRELKILRHLTNNECAYAPKLIKAVYSGKKFNIAMISTHKRSNSTKNVIADKSSKIKKKFISDRNLLRKVDKDLYLVMEKVAFDLDKMMIEADFVECHIITILYNALCGLKQLHNAGLIHRDIKTSNILVDNEC